jgi:hypothetical protein
MFAAACSIEVRSVGAIEFAADSSADSGTRIAALRAKPSHFSP